MATIELTESDFEQTITGKDIVLVDYWAEWCGPCRQFAPVYEEASERHPDVVFAKVDTEAEQQIAAAAQITSIPTLMAFREGVLVFSQPGALPAQALDQVIEGVKGLDMTEVHAQVAAQPSSRGPAGAGLTQQPDPVRSERKGPGMELNPDEMQAIVKRLKRAQGQIGGILKMIDDGRECQDIVTQLAAVSKAVDRPGSPSSRSACASASSTPTPTRWTSTPWRSSSSRWREGVVVTARPVSTSAADWDRRYGGADLVWSAEPNVWVRELCEGLLPGWALDVAAGEGATRSGGRAGVGCRGHRLLGRRRRAHGRDRRPPPR
jgi:thioredoxin 1